MWHEVAKKNITKRYKQIKKKKLRYCERVCTCLDTQHSILYVECNRTIFIGFCCWVKVWWTVCAQSKFNIHVDTIKLAESRFFRNAIWFGHTKSVNALRWMRGGSPGKTHTHIQTWPLLFNRKLKWIELNFEMSDTFYHHRTSNITRSLLSLSHHVRSSILNAISSLKYSTKRRNEWISQITWFHFSSSRFQSLIFCDIIFHLHC